jgi:hypothetical protein
VGTAAINRPIVPAPVDQDDGQFEGNGCQVKPKYSEKTCPSAALPTTNPTCCPDANPGRRGGKPATNRLYYGTALHHDKLQSWHCAARLELEMWTSEYIDRLTFSHKNIMLSYWLLLLARKSIFLAFILSFFSLSLRGSTALWTMADFSVSKSYTQSVELLGVGISPSQGRYLHTR